MRDHPRSRGVYARRRRRSGHRRGSSPLARGLQAILWTAWPWRRIIPARAGFTDGDVPAGEAGWDHPRSRGVYAGEPAPATARRGSSPLARGLHVCVTRVTVRPRIIPARAGFTGLSRGPAAAPRDHPRSRGVYFRRLCFVVCVLGSSPLARGLPIPDSVQDVLVGIIPARAGFTRGKSCPWRPSPDHPRSRGVYVRLHGDQGGVGGSSPLARGLLFVTSWARDYTRIIPARAGFTRPDAIISRARLDHPRSRGVYEPTIPSPVFAAGSSPLARGLRSCGCGCASDAGIIPARAGFTWIWGRIM